MIKVRRFGFTDAPDNVGPVHVLNSRKIEQDEIELLMVSVRFNIFVLH